MGEFKVSVSKRRTVATLFDAELSPLGGEGGRPESLDKLISLRTMAYVQDNILLCATYMTPKEDLFERVSTFQDSLEAG